jgi:copper oxidase (laccase) domain-containing protein
VQKYVKPKLECDSIIHTEKNPLAQKLILLTPAGDCPPNLMAANHGHNESIAVAHAGWRSSLNQVTVNTCKNVLLDLGYQKNEIKILIGPGIDSCLFPGKF